MSIALDIVMWLMIETILGFIRYSISTASLDSELSILRSEVNRSRTIMILILLLIESNHHIHHHPTNYRNNQLPVMSKQYQLDP